MIISHPTMLKSNAAQPLLDTITLSRVISLVKRRLQGRVSFQGDGQRCEAFCARKLLVFMHHARIDFGEIDLRRPISPKSALRNASQRWETAV